MIPNYLLFQFTYYNIYMLYSGGNICSFKAVIDNNKLTL